MARARFGAAVYADRAHPSLSGRIRARLGSIARKANAEVSRLSETPRLKIGALLIRKPGRLLTTDTIHAARANRGQRANEFQHQQNRRNRHRAVERLRRFYLASAPRRRVAGQNRRQRDRDDRDGVERRNDNAGNGDLDPGRNRLGNLFILIGAQQ
jgi:hypothetical protein